MNYWYFTFFTCNVLFCPVLFHLFFIFVLLHLLLIMFFYDASITVVVILMPDIVLIVSTYHLTVLSSHFHLRQWLQK